MKNFTKIKDAIKTIEDAIYEEKSDLLTCKFTDEDTVSIRYVKAGIQDVSNQFTEYLYCRAEEKGKRASLNIDRFYLCREDRKLTPYNINTSFREFNNIELAEEAFERYNKEASEGKQRLNPDNKKYILYKFNAVTQKLETFKK
jgi:hypothetical protein